MPLTDPKRFYAALRQANPQVFRLAVEYATSLGLRLNLDLKATAGVEQVLVVFACELLDVTAT